MAKANVVNTRIVTEETKLTPYFNDYDESKNFHQMLFRPGFAVQGRELTQMQTLLQNQIERFGLHIFENGSSVVGGDVSLITTCTTLNLESSYGNTTIEVSDFKDKTIRYGDSNNDVIARVVETTGASNTSLDSIHIRYLTGDEFPAGATIKVEGEEKYANLVSTANVAANSCLAWIYDSIYFYDGYFVKVPKQSCVVDPYHSLANAKVGLESSDSIVTFSEDTSLLDPALGASNYQAPGADRYKKELVLARRDLDSIDDTKFIEIARVKRGRIEKKVEAPLYSEIEEVLARRTFDESGSYTVRPFIANPMEAANNAAANVAVRLSPGKAYVKGFEYETITDSAVSIPRARTVANVTNYNLNMNYGNYVIVDNLEGQYDVLNQEVFDIHSAQFSGINFTSQGNYDTTKIGTCRIRDVDFFSGDVSVPDRKHELYIFDTQFSGASSFAAANSFVKHKSFTPGASSNANCNITTLNFDNGMANGNATITEPDLSPLVWPLPERYVKEGSSANPSYTYRKVFTSVAFTAGVSGAITVGSGEQFIGTSATSNVASTVTDNFLIIVTDVGTSARTLGEQVKVNVSITGDPEQAVFDTETGGSDTFTAIAYTKVEVEGAGAVPRVKTLVKANTLTMASEASANSFVDDNVGSTTDIYLDTGQVTIIDPSRTPGYEHSLFISDVIGIKKIYDLNGVALPSGGADITGYADVTTRYDFDNGQRDTMYNHASIKLIPGNSPPVGPLIVCTRYYKSTSDEGYFNVDSYPSLTTDITEETINIGTGYAIIPSYTTSAGTKLQLRDCVDFRPKKINASNTSINFTIEGAQVPVSTTDFKVDYDYYLGRRDLLVLKPNDKIRRVPGVPAKYPQNPTVPSDAMVLYTLGVSPYTAYPANVAFGMIDNKRYTMRDIGNIETRLKNMEYYVTLNSLEKEALDISIPDVDGIERTKYGILADNFNDHSLSAYTNFDYKCAVNGKQGLLKHQTDEESHRLVVDTTSGNNVKINEDKIYLDYQIEEFITQNTATKSTAVAEFLFSSYTGTILMNPDSDTWKSTNTAPVFINTFIDNNSTNIDKVVEFESEEADNIRADSRNRTLLTGISVS